MADEISFDSWRPHDASVKIRAMLELDYFVSSNGIVINYTVTQDDRHIVTRITSVSSWGNTIHFYYPVHLINGTDFQLHVTSNTGIRDVIDFTLYLSADCYPRHRGEYLITDEAIRRVTCDLDNYIESTDAKIHRLETTIDGLRADIRSLNATLTAALDAERDVRSQETQWLLGEVSDLKSAISQIWDRILG